MSTRITTGSTSSATPGRREMLRTLAVAGPALLALTLLTACGGGGAAAAGATSTPTQSTGAQPDRPQGGPGDAFPGADGLLAAVEGRTLQVQGVDSQTAVTYSGATKITSTVAARASDIKVGSCVSARPDADAAAGSSGWTASDSTVTAATVTVSAAVDGACPVMFGSAGPGGKRLGGPQGASPSGAPPGTPRGTSSPGGPRGNDRLAGATGKVTSVDGGTFVVERTARPAAAGGGSTASAPPAPTSVTVTTTEATAYTKTVKAGASALRTGTCVTAMGEADDTGTIAATSIALRPADGGQCTNGRLGGGRPQDGSSGA